MGVSRFEDLVAWQKARVLTREVYATSQQGAFGRDFGLCNQVQRASVSVMSNIAEGFDRSRPREFHQALSTAKGSCAEVRSLLYVALDVGYIDQGEFELLMGQATEASQVVGALRAAVERRANSKRPQRPSTQHPARSTKRTGNGAGRADQ